MKKNFSKSLFFYYLPPFLWMGLIFYMSSLPGSGSYYPNSYGQILIRKLAHIFEFGVLALLLFNFFGRFNKRKISWEDSFCWSLIASFLFAFSDEIHQHFVFGRNGRVEDFFVDISAAWLILQILSFRKTKTGKKTKITLIFFNLIILLSSLGLLLEEGFSKEEIKLYHEEAWKKRHQVQEVENKIESNETEIIKKEENIDENEIKEKFLIPDVPFTSQAPFAVWDEIHDESCEEASIIMLEYFRNKKVLTKKEAEKEIQKMVKYQVEEYGDYKDSDAQEIAKLAKDFYGLNLEVIYDFSLEDVKRYLSAGKPIIIPAAGRELENSFFTQPGPLYHNLVLVGYDEDNFVANDPGTRRGEGYVYSQEIVFNAIHDFTGKKKDILKGQKAMLILE